MTQFIGHDVIGLLGAYCFQKEYERPEEHKTRFQGEHTFIDMWVTRRGTTLGIYMPKVKRMKYVRPRTIEQFEEAVILAARI